MTVETAYIGGTHVYARVPQGGVASITFAATDLAGGTILRSVADAFVVARDLAWPVAVRFSGDEVDGPVAHVRVGDDRYAPRLSARLSARVEWGEGEHSPGTVVEPSRRINTSTRLLTIRGRHRYRRSGAHTITVVITDALGPQHLVVRDHLLVPGRRRVGGARHEPAARLRRSVWRVPFLAG